jgi:hypothetical protein
LPDDFRSYLEAFDEYSSEHLDLPYEDDYQLPLCSDFDRSKNIVCLKKDSHDLFLQLPVITLSCLSIEGVVGKYIFNVEFPHRQTLESKGWLGTASLSPLSQFFDFPLIACQSSARSLSIPSLTSEREDALGSQFAGPLSQFSEPCISHDLFLKWIESFPQRWTWQDFIPPTRLHELDFEIFNDMIHVLTHVIFVLDLSLFWFMMKHKGRYRGMLLDWLHWLFDYTNIQPTGKYFFIFTFMIALYMLGWHYRPIFVTDAPIELSRSAGYARDAEVLMRSMVSTCPRVGATCYPRFLGITRRSCLEAHRS